VDIGAREWPAGLAPANMFRETFFGGLYQKDMITR
jgi:hypothetical protein